MAKSLAESEPADAVDPSERKRLKKEKKRALEAAAEEVQEAQEAPPPSKEEKKARKAAKRAAAEAAELAAEAATQESKKRKKALLTTQAVCEDEKTESKLAAEASAIPEASSVKGASKGKLKNEFELYVTGLPTFARDEDVKKHFAECGSIVTFNMPCDKEGKAKGKAFVGFDNKKACDKALQLDGSHFGVYALSVHLSSENASIAAKAAVKFRKCFQVVVGGLPYTMTENDVREHFSSTCGEIIHFGMPSTKKGVAFIGFTSQESCDKAFALHGSKIDGRPLYIQKSGDKGGKSGKGGKGDSGFGKGSEGGKGDSGIGKGSKEFEVFIGGLPFEVTKEVLRKDFAEMGEVVSCRMVVDDEGACKGVAFVEYDNKESCDKALAFDGTEYAGRLLRVRMSGSAPDKSKGPKGKSDKGKGKGKGQGNKELEVVVTGLPFSTTAEVFRKDFEECGEITRLVLPMNEEGNAKGNAYIEYADKAGCLQALQFNETQYGSRWIKVRMSADRGDADTKDAGSTKEKIDTVAKEAVSSGTAVGKVIQFDSDDE